MEEEAAVEDVAAEADVADIEQIRIAIVMPSTITDLAWSQAIYDSLLRLQAKQAARMSWKSPLRKICSTSPTLLPPCATTPTDDFDIVIAHGTQYGTSMFEIAPDFPETSFAWGTATDTGTDQGLDNVFRL